MPFVWYVSGSNRSGQLLQVYIFIVSVAWCIHFSTFRMWHFFSPIFFSSDGYTYSRYFCPPFYTYSEEKKSCVIYYDDPTGNGGNGTMIESIPVENITSIAEQPVGGIPAAGIPLATGTPAAGIPPAGSPLALASKPPAAASIPVASSSPVSAGIPGISTVAMPKT